MDIPYVNTQKKKTINYKEVKILLIQVSVDQSFVQYITKMMTGLYIYINSTQQNNDIWLYVLHTPSRIKYTFKGNGKFSNFRKLSVSDQKKNCNGHFYIILHLTF